MCIFLCNNKVNFQSVLVKQNWYLILHKNPEKNIWTFLDMLPQCADLVDPKTEHANNKKQFAMLSSVVLVVLSIIRDII